MCRPWVIHRYMRRSGEFLLILKGLGEESLYETQNLCISNGHLEIVSADLEKALPREEWFLRAPALVEQAKMILADTLKLGDIPVNALYYAQEAEMKPGDTLDCSVSSE